MLKGIDVYHGDGEVAWPSVYSSGITFAYIKATQGTEYRDPEYRANMTACRAAGCYGGSYAFLRQYESGSDQALAFLADVGDLRGQLVPALDVEAYLTEPWTLDAHETTAKVLAFIATVQQKTGRGMIVYVSPSFADEHLCGDGYVDSGHEYKLAHYPLWVAHYNVSAPRVPAPWSSWLLWQHDEFGTVPGCPNAGGVDLDWFAGDTSALEKLVVRG